MAILYLVRHGEAQPVGSYCVGSGTDLPLTETGRRQGRELGRCFRGLDPGPVYTSPLGRCRETARLLAGPCRELRICPGLRELDMGCWEGLPFETIRRDYPELYAARGEDHSLQPPGAESYPAAASRMDQALSAIAQQLGPAGEGAVLCHSGALRAFLCQITGTPYRENRRWKLPHGSVTILEHSPTGWQLLGAGLPADQRPDDAAIESLWETYGAGDRAQRHCRAVAGKAASLCRGLAAVGVVLDEDLVRRAALLHDLRRQEHRHAQAGARLLRRLGYFRVAAVVAAHEDPDCPPQLDEVGLLYLADKLVQEDREVGIEARFSASLAKCATEEAKQQWERRLRHAQALEDLVRQRLHRL